MTTKYINHKKTQQYRDSNQLRKATKIKPMLHSYNPNCSRHYNIMINDMKLFRMLKEFKEMRIRLRYYENHWDGLQINFEKYTMIDFGHKQIKKEG